MPCGHQKATPSFDVLQNRATAAEPKKKNAVLPILILILIPIPKKRFSWAAFLPAKQKLPPWSNKKIK